MCSSQHGVCAVLHKHRKKALIMTVLQYSEKETGNANNQLTRADQQDDKVVFFFCERTENKNTCWENYCTNAASRTGIAAS
jgi:hypothetical protein